MISFCLPFHPLDCSLVALADTYRLRRNQRIPPLCVLRSHLSDDKYHSLTHSLTYTLTHSLTHSLTQRTHTCMHTQTHMLLFVFHLHAILPCHCSNNGAAGQELLYNISPEVFIFLNIHEDGRCAFGVSYRRIGNYHRSLSYVVV